MSEPSLHFDLFESDVIEGYDYDVWVGGLVADNKPSSINIPETGPSSGIGSAYDIRIGISNPLPENGVFSRVLPKKYAEAFERGEGYIGSGEVWITAADDVAGVTTRSQAQQRLSLYQDYGATIPNTSGDVLVQFKLNDFNSNSLMTPIEIGNTSPLGPIQPRGYGFEQGGRTAGDAREWLIGNGTKDDIGAFDVNLIYLDK